MYKMDTPFFQIMWTSVRLFLGKSYKYNLEKNAVISTCRPTRLSSILTLILYHPLTFWPRVQCTPRVRQRSLPNIDVDSTSRFLCTARTDRHTDVQTQRRSRRSYLHAWTAVATGEGNELWKTLDCMGRCGVQLSMTPHGSNYSMNTCRNSWPG